MNQYFGKILISIGLVFIVLGLLLISGAKIPWLGKLPGDIRVEKENFKFYFPIITCILISLLLTLLFIVIRMIFRR